MRKASLACLLVAVSLAVPGAQGTSGLTPPDLYRLQSVGDVQLSPDGTHVAYSITHNERPGRPYSDTWIRDLATGRITKLNGGSGPRWSRDGRWVAYAGRIDEGAGLIVADRNGEGERLIASLAGTNHPLPTSGDSVAWSPDGRSLAYVSATPGPETDDANGDPMVITRYLYKPTATEGLTRFNDNKRLHLFVVDVATRQVRQLTTGRFYEHSIDWSPGGDEILFVSNREADADKTFNYDMFAVRVRDAVTRRLTSTKSAEYFPTWSPDGTRIAFLGTHRELTSSETTMEDTHVWVMNADGSNRVEIDAGIDNRQGPPQWAPDGRSVYVSVQERGSTKLVRLGLEKGDSPLFFGSLGSWSLATNLVAYTFATPDAPADLFLSSGGGPHGQQGPAFNAKAQVYAGLGWASLMVNYRGSTGYGQQLTDRIFKDQNGGEARDVLAGVDAALATYPWLDAARMGLEGGSYGGQLVNWIITQTPRFKAAIPNWGISNLVTQNYLSYYHDYLAVEYGAFPHEEDIIDRLWDRSAIRYAKNVKTPTLFLHGENDNDVPIAEAEQFFIALKDVGEDTVMVRYPREGHGLRETRHVVDALDRSIAWYRQYFK